MATTLVDPYTDERLEHDLSGNSEAQSAGFRLSKSGSEVQVSEKTQPQQRINPQGGYCEPAIYKEK